MLSVIIPVYNEESTISAILQRLDLIDIEKEIIVVNDGSTDLTKVFIWSSGVKLTYVPLFENHGKGYAIRAGLSRVTGDYVVIQDADEEYDPHDLVPMYSKIRENGVKVVYGSRMLGTGGIKNNSGLLYFWGGQLLTWFANLLYGTHITDEPTGYKMFDTKLLRSLNLECNRFEFCPEVTAKVAKKGVKIHEIGIRYSPRKKGKKINYWDGIIAIWTLLKYKVTIRNQDQKC